MEKDEREQLKSVISILKEWDGDIDIPAEVQYLFYRLTELDTNKNIDLWENLRQTLASNNDLNLPVFQEQIEQSQLTKEGFWWYDPVKWKEKIK